MIARYRLFFMALALPVAVIALVVILLMNVFGGEGGEAEGQATPVVAVTTLAIATLPPVAVGLTPSPTPLPTVTPTPTPTPRPTATPTPTPIKDYVVQEGDTLSEIAESFGLSSEELAKANDIENTDDIKVGQTLIIPAGGSATTPATPTTPRPSTPRPAPTATPKPLKATVDPEDGLNVREKASTSSERLRVLLQGEEISLTGKKSTVSGLVWYELVDGGWVQGQYLTIEGQ